MPIIPANWETDTGVQGQPGQFSERPYYKLKKGEDIVQW